jgi:ABC-type nickel/cobalt efflux system permease component RcnA
VLGILLLSGIILEQADPQLRIMMGVVFILFGIYRLVQYRGKRKNYYTSDDD